ncbi:helix-turn-helix transcriptional regulator [Arthrobacter woluwensis]|uniref:helix-turn-helix transcriptional regulator n=1 Tax=Arthrobacter woluwensis TaxID=156980 RepID=UPI003805BEEC
MTIGFGFGSREWLAIEDVSHLTGLSGARIRQRVNEGTFPAPKRFGARAGLWLESAVDAWITAQGEETTGQASLQPTPAAPLILTHDNVVPIPLGPYEFIDTLHLLLRVYADPADRKPKVVVLTRLEGEIPSVIGRAEAIVTYIDSELLRGAGANATWFVAEAAGEESFHHSYWAENIVLTRRVQKYEHPSFIPSDVGEIDRLIGSHLPWFPRHAMTASTVERWRRNPESTVDVVHDALKVGPLLEALRYLHETSATSPYRALANQLEPIIAAEALTRLAEPLHNDGTTPENGEDSGKWPASFAARLIPYTASARDLELLSSFDAAPDEGLDRLGRDELYGRLAIDLAVWRQEVDEFSPAPFPEIEKYLETVHSVLKWRGRLVDPPTTSVVRIFRAAGKWDQRYRDSWSPERNGEISNTREGRILRKRLHYQEGSTYFAKDGSKNTVAWNEHPVVGMTFAVHWPTHEAGLQIPESARLVADGAVGSRPVYLAVGDEVVGLLPYTSNRAANEWNFGYGGGGPGRLESDILEHFAQQLGVERGALPRRWLEDQVEHCDESELDVRVGDLLRRVAS